MTVRPILPAAVLPAALLAALLAPPVQAQAPDFGADTSMWARDGECDDPRFSGAGMAAGPLQEVDALADATDCRAAFQAGTVTLTGAPAGAGVPAAGGKPGFGGAQPPADPGAQAGAPPAGEIVIDFGDDSSEWARDGECDDRRFVGEGMATVLAWTNAGRDATDCLALWDAGSIVNWDWGTAVAATQCEAIDFGDDTSEFANDGECDDIRFEGFAMPAGVSSEHVRRDATDCSRACGHGIVALRDY